MLLLVNLLLIAGWAYGISRVALKGDLLAGLFPHNPSATSPALTNTVLPASITTTKQPTSLPVMQATGTPTPTSSLVAPQPVGTLALDQGLIILALDEGGNTHLYAYQPEATGTGQPLPLTRLTYGPWDDINPAISPDGQTVAFASNRSGYWDIYLMNLASGGITRLTDTLEYDGAPAWSPDQQWLVYETYLDGSLELKVQSVTTASDVFLLTENPAADFSPAWSPRGRQIAFVSNRSGENEVWLADLDKSANQRFQNLSQNAAARETHPAWSPDGASLVWVSEQDGIRSLYLNELSPATGANPQPSVLKQQNLGSGDWPVWSADGEMLVTTLLAPNHTYLTAYRVRYAGLVLPALELPGSVSGLSWGSANLSTPLPSVYQQAAALTPTPLYTPVLTFSPGESGGRFQLSPLEGIDAPDPYLHDQVDESFQALRMRIASDAGWDFLSKLDNAFVPITSPLDPGMGNDWLYTGRAIGFNTIPVDAGWVMVVRQDFGPETYWRVYLRSFYQDGSSGIPLHDQPWDFNSRYDGNTAGYEQGGGAYASLPPGYWVDFTQRAYAYGWERLPGLNTWRASYPAARFNEFANTGGLDWRTAMLELYPPETMITPSPVVPPTRTPTPTSRWYVSPTPTETSTPRPTYTPWQPTQVSVSATPGG